MTPLRINGNKYRSQLLIHFLFGWHREVGDGFNVILLKCKALDQSVVRLEVGIFERLGLKPL